MFVVCQQYAPMYIGFDCCQRILDVYCTLLYRTVITNKYVDYWIHKTCEVQTQTESTSDETPAHWFDVIEYSLTE